MFYFKLTGRINSVKARGFGPTQKLGVYYRNYPLVRSELNFLIRRDFLRAALLECMTPLFAALSRAWIALAIADSLCSLLPPSMALLVAAT